MKTPSKKKLVHVVYGFRGWKYGISYDGAVRDLQTRAVNNHGTRKHWQRYVLDQAFYATFWGTSEEAKTWLLLIDSVFVISRIIKALELGVGGDVVTGTTTGMRAWLCSSPTRRLASIGSVYQDVSEGFSIIIPTDRFQASLHPSATKLTDIFPWIFYTARE